MIADGVASKSYLIHLIVQNEDLKVCLSTWKVKLTMFDLVNNRRSLVHEVEILQFIQRLKYFRQTIQSNSCKHNWILCWSSIEMINVPERMIDSALVYLRTRFVYWSKDFTEWKMSFTGMISTWIEILKIVRRQIIWCSLTQSRFSTLDVM